MRWRSAVPVLVILTLAGCSTSSGKTATPTTPSLPATPVTTKVKVDPCALLTAQDASKLTGRTLRRSTVNAVGQLVCAYAAGTRAGAEITVRFDADAAAAHAEFPVWVQPFAGQAAGLTVTSVPGLGNEASATHNLAVNDGIYVRRGPTLIKIGAFPAVSNAALLAAARTALARIRAAG